ncbi:hypothetical protein TWF694_002300 [Orbilia ellipsospora]|uniref:Methyltransferase domain-containing protein n=1 Tax=Orbilia ellipsospora TaxID=2528407 RepID=A0AAV9X2M0_9PEZI
MAEKQEESLYLHGHHSSVLSSHSWRTIHNSAAYLLPYLKPYTTSQEPTTLLDAGCGPGTITCDLAAHLPNTQVTGIDVTILDSCAPLAASRKLKNITFKEADVFNLPFPDNSFDIIHLHQVLQHLPTPPVAAIKELLRVCKPNGIVAARDGDFGAFTWYPESKPLDNWRRVYISTAKAIGAEPLAGRMLHKWFMEAGVQREHITCSSSCWTYSSPQEREWWGGIWAERTVKSSFAGLAVKEGIVGSEEELKEVAEAWREWIKQEDGWIMVPSEEVVVKVVKN